MNDTYCDVIVVGAGMAGASVAADLSRTHKVVVLEEAHAPGYHATGRSAALFLETYGNGPVRALSRASRRFFYAPPPVFGPYPLVAPRGALYTARADQIELLEKVLAQGGTAAQMRRVDTVEALALSPALRFESAAAGGAFEESAADIDVHALHQGYLRIFRERGGFIATDAPVAALSRNGTHWKAETPVGAFHAAHLINAAGAWADRIASLAGVRALGIQPCRRTAILVELPAGINAGTWPLTIAVDESYYFKPDAGLLLISPADETPSEPCDVQPEELDVATGIFLLERATNLTVARIRRKWAGLRSFAPDRSLVIGFDAEAPGFFWLAGQGGYGIQTAPAASALAGALLRQESLPAELGDFDPICVSPLRFDSASHRQAST